MLNFVQYNNLLNVVKLTSFLKFLMEVSNMNSLKNLFKITNLSSSNLIKKNISQIKLDHKKKVVCDKAKTRCAEMLIEKDACGCTVPLPGLKIKKSHWPDERSISIAIIGGGPAIVYATLLLKQNPAIKEISLIDTDNSLAGPVCDLRDIDTSVLLRYFKKTSLLNGVRNADIVAIMDETKFSIGDRGPFSQFMKSANYVKSIAECTMNACPSALIAVFTHPVTATLPLVTEIYKRSHMWDPNKIIGSVALESMRMNTLIAHYLYLNPAYVTVPMSGGVDPLTIVPLMSRARPFNNFSKQDQIKFVEQLRSMDKTTSKSSKDGLTMEDGIAAAKFISILINGLKRKSISIASAYVRSEVFPSCDYMTSELKFGPNGIEKNFGMPKVNSAELVLLEQSMPMLNKIIESVRKFLSTGKI